MSKEVRKDHQAIIEYYDKTKTDYLWAWTDEESSAFHFGFYDENATNHKDALKNTNKVLAELAEIKKGDRVLDAGCGIGGSSFWLAKNIGAKPVGITLCPDQVKTCKKRAEKLGLENETEFIEGDFCNSPFEDNTFDVIWSCETLCYIKDKQEFYNECYRLLKPGGRVIISDAHYTKSDFTPEERETLDLWIEGWAMQGFNTEEEHQEMASKAGFKDFKVMDYTNKTFVSLRNLYVKSKQWLGVCKLAKFLGLRNEIQMKNQIASIKQFEALDRDKTWFYAVTLAKKD